MTRVQRERFTDLMEYERVKNIYILRNKMLEHTRPNLRILLLNNGGGEIFHTLPGLDMSGTSHKFIAAVHKTSAKGWAEERGFLYMKVEDGDELTEAMKTFTQPEEMEQPVLLEVFTNKNKDARMLKNYYYQIKEK